MMSWATEDLKWSKKIAYIEILMSQKRHLKCLKRWESNNKHGAGIKTRITLEKCIWLHFKKASYTKYPAFKVFYSYGAVVILIELKQAEAYGMLIQFLIFISLFRRPVDYYAEIGSNIVRVTIASFSEHTIYVVEKQERKISTTSNSHGRHVQSY